MSYNKYYHPTTWEDFPSENTAIDAQRLNHLEDGVDELDDRICALDVNKSQVSWNQQLLTGDKIAEISINGVVKSVYAPNVDGASQQAQAAALVSEGHAQGTQGGSAVGPGSQYYHNNAKYYAEQASTSFDNKIASEGYALGTENGDPVTSGSIYYHNNAKYYAEQARSFTPEGYQELVDEVEEKIDKSDVDVKSVTTGKFDTVTGGLMQKCVVDLEPIQSGSGTPSPSNVRAISGHTQVQVENVGKNKCNPTGVSGSYSGYTVAKQNNGEFIAKGTGTTSSAVAILVGEFNAKRGVSYTLNGCPSGGSANSYRLDVRTNATTLYGSNIFDYGNGVAFTPTDDVTLYVYMRFATQYAISNQLQFAPMLRYSTDTDPTYEPYNGYTTIIDLGGTYYGGTLDAVSGVLTVTHAFVTMGDFNWTTSTAGGNVVFKTQASLPNVKILTTARQTNGISSAYEFSNTANDKTCFIYNTDGCLYVRDTSYTTASDFKTDVSDVQVCYEINPTTIQLTPTQLETLVGQNDVFAPLDGQTVDRVDYKKIFTWDDVKTYVDSKIS